MKGFLAVLLFMGVTLVMFTRTLPMPAESLSYRLAEEWRAVRHLR